MINNITQDQKKRLGQPRKDNSPGKRKPWSTGTEAWGNKLMSLLKLGILQWLLNLKRALSGGKTGKTRK